jgi:cytochrome P450 family 144
MDQTLSGTELLDSSIIQNPHPFYRRLLEQAPVWRVPGTDVVVVSSFEMLAEAARRVEDFSSNMRCLLYRDESGLPARLQFGDMAIQTLATADPPLHTVHKRTVFPELVAKRLALFEPEIMEDAIRYTEGALAKGNFDFMTEIGNMVPISVISRLIGFRDSDLDSLLRSALNSVAMLAGTGNLEKIQELWTASNITAWIAEQLAHAADTPGDDILTSIENGVASGVLKTAEGITILQTMLAAGGESTTSLLGNATRILADDQALQAQLRAEPERIPAFVEEAARLEPPFRHHMRYATKDTELGGVEIPAGATILLFWGAANRDPAMFESPDELLIGRPIRHVTFGRGIHQCVGATLARLEAKIVLTVLLERTRNFAIEPGQTPEWVDSLMVRRYERLPLQLTPQ